MSYQEKRSYAQIVGNITGFIIYFLFIVDLNTISEIDQITFGKYLFLIVPVLVITQVIVKILFDIVNNTHTKGEEPSFVDEYDQMIELKSVRNFMFVFVFGFFATMLGLWFNLSLATAFLIMLGFIFIAGSTLELSYIYFYRRGV